ncbi:MAG TPA: DUF2800 domain-containing protein [Rhodanobacter sp.]|nr:DUF2800 domain-containing protein [Rhodanobacter sp.]
MSEVPAGHSPLGMSGAERFMACPGSVGLSEGLHDDDDDGEFAKPGTAAHELLDLAFQEQKDAWEYIGGAIEKPMADAVQVCLSAVRKAHPDRNQGNFWTEEKYYCPTIHALFYGTADIVYLDELGRVLHIWDYKHGAGIYVEVKHNPQTMGYACGALEQLKLWDQVDMVVLHIVQPRCFGEAHRMWSISTENLEQWLLGQLIPAMDRALVSRDTASGEHCRFCPVRFRACPQLVSDMAELETMMGAMSRTADELTNEQVSRFLTLLETAKIVGKAASKTAFGRLEAGHKIAGFKLAKAKANRIFKDGAEAAAKAAFGDSAYTAPELLSPAQMEALPEGEAFVARWAFKPDTGLTVVKDMDPRAAVNQDTKAMFQAATKTRKV